MEHQLQKLSSKWWSCSVCKWQWQSKPKSSCPGVWRYSWQSKPNYLHSKTELSKRGLKLAPNQQVRGIVQSGDGKEWWQLYDEKEAIAKQKKSPPSKSTRPPCPIGLDCLLIAAERGKPCPNKYYCSNQAKPWFLPYRITIEPDGTRCMFISLGSGTEAQEKKAAGFAEAESLPYKFIESDLGKPVLIVFWSKEKAGWIEAEHLPADYPFWAAARNGAKYEEFRYLERCHWRQHWCHYESRKSYEREVPKYPHCILSVW